MRVAWLGTFSFKVVVYFNFICLILLCFYPSFIISHSIHPYCLNLKYVFRLKLKINLTQLSIIVKFINDFNRNFLNFELDPNFAPRYKTKQKKIVKITNWSDCRLQITTMFTYSSAFREKLTSKTKKWEISPGIIVWCYIPNFFSIVIAKNTR